MLDRIKHLLGPAGADKASAVAAAQRIQVATCVLFLEVANADSAFQESEAAFIQDLLERKFGLSSESVADLMALAESRREATFDLYQFTKEINRNFSLEEKLEVLENLWRVVYADGTLDKFEDALMHQLATLLRLSPRQMIDMKVKVLDELRPNR